MPLDKYKLLLEFYPELKEEYNLFKRLEDINRKKLEAIQSYLKYWDGGSLREIKRQFQLLKKLVFEDKYAEQEEKRYVLRFLKRIKEKGWTPPVLDKLIQSLNELNNVISLQIHIIYKDPLMWQFRSNFQKFIQLVKREQEIIQADLTYLHGIASYYANQIPGHLKKNAEKVLNIGHRGGASGIYAENTIGSMKLALQFGVDMIEFDIQPCKTEELIVMHDAKVDRLTDGHGYIKYLSLSDIKKLRIKGAPQEKISTLDDALKFLYKKCQINIEIKTERLDKRTIQHLVDVLLRTIENGESYIVVSSFNHDVLGLLKTKNPAIRIAVLFEPLGFSVSTGWHLVKARFFKKTFSKQFVRTARNLRAEAINSPFHLVDEDFIKYIHSNNLKVNVWTVNNPYFMVQLILWGVDGIFTDRPDILQKVKHRLIEGGVLEDNEIIKLSEV